MVVEIGLGDVDTMQLAGNDFAHPFLRDHLQSCATVSRVLDTYRVLSSA
jgi:hypothetical protein